MSLQLQAHIPFDGGRPARGDTEFHGKRASLKLEHQDRAALRDDRLSALDLVDAVLDTLGVETPAGSDSDVLFALDLK